MVLQKKEEAKLKKTRKNNILVKTPESCQGRQSLLSYLIHFFTIHDEFVRIFIRKMEKQTIIHISKKKNKIKNIAQAILHGSDGIFLISRCVMITSVSAAKVKAQSTTAHQTFIKLWCSPFHPKYPIFTQLCWNRNTVNTNFYHFSWFWPELAWLSSVTTGYHI